MPLSPLASALLAALLPLQALAQPLGLEACRALRQRREALAAAAMQAEIALVLATRQRLCPQQEALAEQANATTAQAEQSATAPLDYSAYLECRRRAEQRLRNSRPILYTNQKGFTFYTLEGARLARQAEEQRLQLVSACASAPDR